jgi:hypothetical protein
METAKSHNQKLTGDIEIIETRGIKFLKRLLAAERGLKLSKKEIRKIKNELKKK